MLLAKHLLQGQGRTLAAGGEAAWTFLIRTPEMIEAGIRQILLDGLGGGYVRKVGRQSTGSSLTFNPDLVFGEDRAVGDVKYKVSSGEWTRSDLYQAIAFAEAFQTKDATIVRFRQPNTDAVVDVTVGTKTIHEITWLADTDRGPEAVAADLVAQARAWLGIDSAVAA